VLQQAIDKWDECHAALETAAFEDKPEPEQEKPAA
jgi:hypothetical protein